MLGKRAQARLPLWIIRNREEARFEFAQVFGSHHWIDPRCGIGDKRLHCFEAQVFESAALNAMEDVAHLAVASTGREPLGCSAGRQGEKGPSSDEITVLKALPICVGNAVRTDPVEPTLDDSWHPAPPQRKDEYKKIGAHEPILLANQIGGKATSPARMQLLRLIMKAGRIGCRFEIVSPCHRHRYRS